MNIKSRIKSIVRLVIPAAVLLLVSSTAASAELPGGVTPNDVYGALDQVNRNLDVLLEASHRRTPPAAKNYEVGVHPMHVFQMAVTCANRTGELLLSAGGQPSERTVVRPQKYSPKDVLGVAENMLANIRGYGKIKNVSNLPGDRGRFTNKAPNDVYALTLEIFTKVSTLAGKAKISPNEVYSSMAVAVEEARLILNHTGHSFDQDAVAPEPRRKPRDVFAKAIEARTTINEIRRSLSLPEIPIPVVAEADRIRPIDVFVQSQILLGELNILKMATGTTDETAQAQKVSGTRPTEVWGQVSLIEHLVKQITPQSTASASP